MKYFLDTNVLIAHLKKKDEFKTEAGKLLRQIDDGKVSAEISVASMIKIAYVLKSAGMKQAEITEALDIIHQIRNLEIVPIRWDTHRLAAEYMGWAPML